MARDKATHDKILEVIVDRLRSRIDEFNPATCFLSDEPFPLKVPPSDIFCTVAPTDGAFSDLFTGGGQVTVNEETGFIVSVFSRLAGDEVDHAREAMINPDLGLLTHYKGPILKALLKNWEPTFQANELLRDQLYPTASTAPRTVEDPNLGKFMRMSIIFVTSFDWDI